MRKFELINTETRSNLLPTRSTKASAGYDFKAAERVLIKPDRIGLVKTNVKASMESDEVLFLFDRSSNPYKNGIILINSVGVIDSDYYNNPDNEGNIIFMFKNITDDDVVIEPGERIGQGVFSKFLVVDDDNTSGNRIGGIGSTGA